MATINIVQRTKQSANGEFGIYLRFTKDRRHTFIYLNKSCEKSDWNPIKQEFRKGYIDYIQNNSALQKIRSRAENIISKTYENGNDISIEEFKDLFLNFRNEKNTPVYEFWEDYLNDLVKSGRTGTARYYKECRQVFFKFSQNRNLYFKDITPLLLSKFEVFLRERGNRETGIAVRMRGIRSVYNNAIQKGFAKKEHYPFGTYKVSKLKGETEKRALSIEDMQKIIHVDISKFKHLTNTKNYFLFSYFLGGINFVDMMKLTWENIQKDRIRYVRSKTKSTFDISMLPPVIEILDYYRSKPTNTNYVFPILLNSELTPTQIENRKAKTLKQFNKELKELASLAGVDEKLTSYVARHTFATNLKLKGVSTDIISESMGHKNVAITSAYLKSFNKSVIDEAMEKLL